MDEKLNRCDILIFEAGDDWIGRTIAWLTKSNVSHAAVVRREGTIAEMGSGGVMLSGIRLAENARPAYVMRHMSALPPEPVERAIDRYVDAEVRYDFPLLWILAGLLVYRGIRPTRRFEAIADRILRAACRRLDEAIKSAKYDGKEAMVCSQFVYQVFLDAGADYAIRIENGDLQARGDLDDDGRVRLVDVLQRLNADGQPEEDDAGLRSLDGAPAEDGDLDALARELYAAMTEPEDEEVERGLFGGPRSVDLTPLARRAGRFLDLVEAFLRTTGSNVPIESLFVTPSDLLDHAANLVRAGRIGVERI